MHIATTNCGTEFWLDSVDSVSRIVGHSRSPFLDSNGYVRVCYKSRRVSISRLLTQCPEHLSVDHISGNILDNRLCNLRICTTQQNIRNMRSKGGTSKYKGVNATGYGTFKARIMVDGRNARTRTFTSELSAAIQYDIWAVELFGEFAWLNRDHFSELQECVSSSN